MDVGILGESLRADSLGGRSRKELRGEVICRFVADDSGSVASELGVSGVNIDMRGVT